MEQNLITDVLSALKFTLTAEQLRIVSDTLVLKLNEYEIKKKETQLLASNDISLVLLDQFLCTKEVEGKSSKTIKRYREINLMMLDFIQKPLFKISTYDLRHYLTAYKTTRKVCNRTLDGMRRCICSFFAWMNAEGIISKNPCLGLGQIKYTKTIKKPYSIVEMERIKQSCDNVRDLALIEFLYYSGCRVSEVVNLDRDDINFDTKDAIVLGKGEKERTIYLSPIAIMRLQDYLRTRKDCNPCLFASLRSPYNRLSKAGIEYVLKKLGTFASVENVHPHRYRRTLATNLLNRGANIQDVAAILGHSDLKTTQIYCYINQTTVRASYEKFSV